jgi:hypothetical protein
MSMGWSPMAMTGMMLRAPLEITGLMIDAYVEGARVFWSFWGPFGEPAISTIEMIAGMQRRTLGLFASAIERATVE